MDQSLFLPRCERVVHDFSLNFEVFTSLCFHQDVRELPLIPIDTVHCSHHMQVSCYVPFGTKRQLLSLTELKSHLFQLYFIG